MWIPFTTVCIFLGIFSFMKWKRQVIVLYFLFAMFLFLITLYYEKVSLILYMGILVTCILYPIICIFISFKLKELIILNKTNKDLIHTIQTILQVFPEGVIIRSLDERTKQTLTKFANNIACKDFGKEQNQDEIKLDIIEIDSQQINTECDREVSIKFEEFLTKQENSIHESNSDCIERMIKIRQPIDHLQEELVVNNEEIGIEENFFNVKSIKVSWENNDDSFMHVFINTTQVKKLEEERANREYQHMMFASLSHELRTPLNAFSNSLYLIKFTFDEIKQKIQNSIAINREVESLYPRLYKFAKIGEVSSCLLMNLVDDILDMSKFTAQTFKLNIDKFNLSDLINDIDYIFGFQCAEKHLDFIINAHTNVTKNPYYSDLKRIKQVLINLISNSFKFTERGSIKLKISEFERHGEVFLKFVVSDTGVGISQQDIPKLFKMFGMLSKHRSKLNKSGTGLGLAISKRIVESLGGKIKVSSEENKWTRFTFTTAVCNKYQPFIQNFLAKLFFFKNKIK